MKKDRTLYLILTLIVASSVAVGVQGVRIEGFKGQIYNLEKKLEGLNLIHEEILLYKSIEDSLFSQAGVFMKDEKVRILARIVFRYHHKYGTNGTVPIGLDWQRILSWVEVESAFDPKAESSAGALGLTQQMPFTAQEGLEKYMNVKVSIEKTKEMALRPEVNLVLGLERLVEYQQRFMELGHASPSDWKLAFSLYLWSKESFEALLVSDESKTPKASLKYAMDIEEKMKKYKGAKDD